MLISISFVLNDKIIIFPRNGVIKLTGLEAAVPYFTAKPKKNWQDYQHYKHLLVYKGEKFVFHKEVK
jgi:hypothetical protein